MAIRAVKEFDDTSLFWEINNNSNAYSKKLLDEALIKINQIADNPLLGEEIGRNFSSTEFFNNLQSAQRKNKYFCFL